MTSSSSSPGESRDADRLRFKGWRVAWEPRDLRLGVYWTRDDRETWHRRGIDNPALPAIEYRRLVYVCLVPCLPIVLTWSNR